VVDVNFSPDSCEVAQQCVGAHGLRTVLAFDLMVENQGLSSLVLGSAADNPDLLSHTGSCLGVDEVQGFADFELLDDASAVVASSLGRGLCIADSASDVFGCGNQGLGPGEASLHERAERCMFVDITDVAPGDYTLRVTVDAAEIVAESNEQNNSRTESVLSHEPAADLAPGAFPMVGIKQRVDNSSKVRCFQGLANALTCNKRAAESCLLRCPSSKICSPLSCAG
jgi:hypothetical protein